MWTTKEIINLLRSLPKRKLLSKLSKEKIWKKIEKKINK